MLRDWFVAFNEEYFDGHLPLVSVRFSRTAWGGASGLFHTRNREIEVDEDIEDTDKIMAVLLHEMVHLWQSCQGLSVAHGKEFKRWQRLLKRRTGRCIVSLA